MSVEEATIIDKLAGLKERADRLDRTILKDKSKNAVMLPYAKNILGDVERIVLPSARKAAREVDRSRWLGMGQFQLASVEILLKGAEDTVAKFGPDFDTAGG
jgi:hypothetical protein